MENKIAKPFLKWASGGKTQLILEIEKAFPFQITKSKELS